MSRPGAASRTPVLVQPIRDLFAQLTTLQKLSAGFAVAGTLFMYLATVFNWYTVTIKSKYDSFSYTQKQQVSIGTLVTGDTEEQYTNPFAGSSSSHGRPDFNSWASVYAIVYVVLALTLVALVIVAFTVQHTAQLSVRIVAAALAAVSMLIVILISSDLSGMAKALETFMSKELSGGLTKVSYEVHPGLGAGLIMAAVASLLLGLSAGLNQPRATTGVPARPAVQPASGPPTGWVQPASAPPAGWAPPASAPPAGWGQPTSAPPAGWGPPPGYGPPQRR